MPATSDRLARVVRVRELQKRVALGEEGKLARQRASLDTMIERVDMLRAAYSARAGEADAALLKGMAYQHGRLQAPRDATVAQRRVVDSHLAAARVTTLDTHRRERAAEELRDRAAKREAVEADRRADRAVRPTVARPLHRVGEDTAGSDGR